MRGKKDGRSEGRGEGRKEGRKEGRMEGKKDGRMDGRKEGRKEGRKGGRPAAKYLHTDGMRAIVRGRGGDAGKPLLLFFTFFFIFQERWGRIYIFIICMYSVCILLCIYI
jgi:hypothetical protein